ncbi:MAG: bifunctional ADP-heptose synthase [Ardenticatenia bacterium]|nr:bifunctional ADP-heptose synthase [Ardenticatenia bacterium]
MLSTVLVVGDVMLDEYLIGRATRLSREAPVPVLERTRRHVVPGGAANPAVNIVRLGGQAVAVGVIGNDPAGRELEATLLAAGVDTEGLIVDPSRPTTTKTRILAEGSFVHGQHLARIDHVDRRPLDVEVEGALAERLSRLVPGAGAILISNYRNGVVTDELIQRCLALRARHALPLLVDSQGGLGRFQGFDVVKCNRAEAEAELGEPLRPAGDGRAAQLAALRARCRAGAVVVTLGEEGIAWLDRQGYGECPPQRRATVFDVTGAGDTVMAVLTLAFLAGLPLARACWLANVAAGLVLQVLGNYAPTRAELVAHAASHAAEESYPP